MTLTDTPPLTDTPAQDALATVAPPLTAGGQIHKWGTYLGIDWAWNTMSGVTFSDWAEFNETGQKLWSKPVGEGFDKVLSFAIQDVDKRAASVKNGTMFANIIMGGMMTIPPLLLLENKTVKKSIVQWLDRSIYGNERVENDPQFQQSYAAMENEPKKDFAAGMLARFAALTPLLTLVLWERTREPLEANYFSHLKGGSETLATSVGFTKERLGNHTSPEHLDDRWKNIHKSAAMDFGFGFPYAVMHEFFYNKFANLMHHKEKRQEVLPPEALRQSGTINDIPPQGGEVLNLNAAPTRTVTHATAAKTRALPVEEGFAAVR